MKKFFLIILVFCMCISILSSCGNNDSTSKGEIDSTQTSMDSAPTEIKPTETVEPTADKSKEFSGILVAVWNCRSKSKSSVEIISVNPESGEQKTIRSFVYDDCSLPIYNRYKTDQELFSSDYKKAAATKSIGDKGYYCAGWLDENGKFFNVTEALGQLPTSDFSDGCKYHAVGFIGDYFVWMDNPFIDPNQVQYYAVPVDNITPENIINLTVDMEEFVPSSVKKLSKPNLLWVGRWETCHPSDILDDGRVIVGEYIVNPSTGEKISYIPGGNRKNWDGMANPSNDKICFFSMYNSAEKTGLYTVDLVGGEPVKINCDLPSSVRYNSYSGIAYEVATEKVYDTITCSMIDWIE